MHYYQHHIGDFIKATSRLTDAQSMAYLRLLWLYYEQEKPLPNDIPLLAFQIGSEQSTIELILKSFFKLENNEWIQNRCNQVISDYHDLITKKSKAGKASAEQRKNKSSTPVEQVNNISKTDVQQTINHKSINHKPNKNIVAKPEGLSDVIWSDFLTLRKSKKLPLTQTAMKGLERESKKANLPINDVLQICCERGWAGFKAEWINTAQNKKELPLGNEQQIAYAYTHECGGDPTKARFNSYWEMRDFILKFRDKKKNERL